MTKVRVVVVEENQLIRVSLCAALNQYGDIEVIGNAANGNDGLQEIITHKPDVALLDIGLPDIDGIEVTRKIKQYQKTNYDFKTKVLIHTLQDSEDAIITAFSVGANSYIVKNSSIDNLVQAIHSTFKGNTWINV